MQKPECRVADAGRASCVLGAWVYPEDRSAALLLPEREQVTSAMDERYHGHRICRDLVDEPVAADEYLTHARVIEFRHDPPRLASVARDRAALRTSATKAAA